MSPMRMIISEVFQTRVKILNKLFTNKNKLFVYGEFPLIDNMLIVSDMESGEWFTVL